MKTLNLKLATIKQAIKYLAIIPCVFLFTPVFLGRVTREIKGSENRINEPKR